MQWIDGLCPPKMHKNVGGKTAYSTRPQESLLRNLQGSFILQDEKIFRMRLPPQKHLAHLLLQYHQCHYLVLFACSRHHSLPILSWPLRNQHDQVCPHLPHGYLDSLFRTHSYGYDFWSFRQEDQNHWENLYLRRKYRNGTERTNKSQLQRHQRISKEAEDKAEKKLEPKQWRRPSFPSNRPQHQSMSPGTLFLPFLR